MLVLLADQGDAGRTWGQKLIAALVLLAAAAALVSVLHSASALGAGHVVTQRVDKHVEGGLRGCCVC